MMDISIIVPVYNCKAYLPGCVESICAAGQNSWELLLVDDGSTDGSGALCDALAEQNPRIRVIHQENAGASAARNRGLREATGTHILFVDADDSMDAAALGQILADPRLLQGDMTLFGMTFDYYRKGNRYRRDSMYYDFDGLLPPERWGSDFDTLFQCNSLSPLWNKVFRRDILTKHGLQLNESMFLYEDLEFVLRYLTYCDVIWNVPKAVYHYRQPEDEGNAGRRLRRIGSIPEFLQPIEAALTRLQRANPAVADGDAVLQRLYLILARGKLGVSSKEEIRQLCRDFVRWSEDHPLPLEADAFQQRLRREQVSGILWVRRKSALRHYVAVRVKALLRRKQE